MYIEAPRIMEKRSSKQRMVPISVEVDVEEGETVKPKPPPRKAMHYLLVLTAALLSAEFIFLNSPAILSLSASSEVSMSSIRNGR